MSNVNDGSSAFVKLYLREEEWKKSEENRENHRYNYLIKMYESDFQLFFKRFQPYQRVVVSPSRISKHSEETLIVGCFKWKMICVSEFLIT